MKRNNTAHVLTVLTKTSLGQELCSLRKTPAKQSTTHKWTTHADTAEYGTAQGTKISIYIFQKQQQTGRDSSNINSQAAEPGEGGRPFWPAGHTSIYIEMPSPVTSSISLSTKKCYSPASSETWFHCHSSAKSYFCQWSRTWSLPGGLHGICEMPV